MTGSPGSSGNDCHAEERAARLLDRWGSVEGSTPASVLAILERARLTERLGEHDRAGELYRFVADLWRRADPPLWPYVAEAETGLQRLEAAKAR